MLDDWTNRGPNICFVNGNIRWLESHDDHIPESHESHEYLTHIFQRMQNIIQKGLIILMFT